MQVEATLVLEVAVRGVQSEAVYRRYLRELCFVYTRVYTHTRCTHRYCWYCTQVFIKKIDSF